MNIPKILFLNLGIVTIILSLLIIDTGYASWLSYFNICLGIGEINLALINKLEKQQ